MPQLSSYKRSITARSYLHVVVFFFAEKQREQGEVEFSIYSNNKKSKLFPQTSLIHVLWEAASQACASQACDFLVMPRLLAKTGADADMGICTLIIVLKLSFFLHRASNGH